MPADDVLVRAEGVSKKFCRDLKRSLRYGVQDMVAELLALRNRQGELRQGEFWAVKDVSFELRRGEALGLIGPNGAGKTTLLRMLNGLIKPDEGRITMCGRVGALIQLGAGFNPILTGRENIYINAAVLGISKEEIEQKLDDIIGFADIGDFTDAPVQYYSSGMKVRLGFSVAINLRPDIMLIDEVLAVGDLSFRNKCLEAIREIRDSGVAFIFVSHNLGQVSLLCDKVIYLKSGHVISYGTAEQVISAYATDSPHDPKKFVHEAGTEQFMEVHDLQLLNEKDEPIEQVVSDAPLKVRLVFEVKRTLHAPLFHFQLVPSDEQRIVASFHQQKGEKRPSFLPGIHVIDAFMERFPLLAGRYSLRLTVNGPNLLDKYGRIYNLGTIDVVPWEGQWITSNRGGFVELDAAWHIDSEADPAKVTLSV